jgi:transposase
MVLEDHDGHDRYRPAQGHHTAVAIDDREQVLTERLVRATHRQVPELVAWADQLGNRDRIWAVESAGGLGYLLAQQLLAAGETVVDIPATLASRVRLLGSGRWDKNDSNDARSVAIEALRARCWCRSGSRTTPPCGGCCPAATPSGRGRGTRPPVGSMLWSLTWCRAGSARKSSCPRPWRCSRVSRRRAPPPSNGSVSPSRWSMTSTASRPNHGVQGPHQDRVAASGTTLTDIFGVGDVVAASLSGHSGDIGRFPTGDRFAADNGTAPSEWSSGNPKRPTHRLSRRGNRAMNPRPARRRGHPSSATPTARAEPSNDRKLSQGQTPKEATRALKRRLSTVFYRHLIADAARRH